MTRAVSHTQGSTMTKTTDCFRPVSYFIKLIFELTSYKLLVGDERRTRQQTQHFIKDFASVTLSLQGKYLGDHITKPCILYFAIEFK